MPQSTGTPRSIQDVADSEAEPEGPNNNFVVSMDADDEERHSVSPSVLDDLEGELVVVHQRESGLPNGMMLSLNSRKQVPQKSWTTICQSLSIVHQLVRGGQVSDSSMMWICARHSHSGLQS